MQLVVDIREKEPVKTAIKDVFETVLFEQMDVGDIGVRGSNGEWLVIFERKTVRDLAASINDGRYREQKIRLMSVIEPLWKGYIIEEAFPEAGIRFPGSRRVITKGAYCSVLLGLSMRDGMKVFQTDSLNGTVELLKSLMRKLPEYVKASESNGDDEQTVYQASLVKAVQVKKKQNLTAETCFIAQLTQIPGMSFNMATAVAASFSTMTAVAHASQGELEGIIVGKRKLGPVLAKRVKEYIQ